MFVLGLHLGYGLETELNRGRFEYHDAAAVLLKDGEVIAAIEEERLSRVKHCNFFPQRAIGFCLQQAGVTLSDVDVIAVNHSQFDAQQFAMSQAFNDTREPMISGEQFVSSHFERLFGVNVCDKLAFVTTT